MMHYQRIEREGANIYLVRVNMGPYIRAVARIEAALVEISMLVCSLFDSFVVVLGRPRSWNGGLSSRARAETWAGAEERVGT